MSEANFLWLSGMEGISEGRRRAHIKSDLEKVASLKGWEIPANAIEICRHEDGSDYLLGEGGFGQVTVHKMIESWELYTLQRYRT